MGDQQRVVAGVAVGGDHLGEDLAVRTVDRFHRRLVAEVAKLNFVEAHGFDDPGVVRGEEGVDLEAGRLLHVGKDGRPLLAQRLGVLRGNDAEIDLRRLGMDGGGDEAGGKGERSGESGKTHGELPRR